MCGALPDLRLNLSLFRGFVGSYNLAPIFFEPLPICIQAMMKKRKTMRNSVKPQRPQKIWDLFIRLFHWLLVLAVGTAIVTAEFLQATWLEVHIWAGASAAALIVARLIWGFLGGGYARFSGFELKPAALLDHLKQLLHGTAPRHLGHNPLGGWMVLALIAVILAIATSGAILLGGVFKTGPLAFGFSYDTARNFGELHEVFANILLVLVAVHIAGALFESWRSRENLPKAIVTGLKAVRPGDHRPAGKPARRRAGVIWGMALIGGGITAGAWLSGLPGYGVPDPTPNPVYVKACSDCHMAYPPSLLKAEHWSLLMQNLQDHFGEDASLDSASWRAVSDYLAQNGAETTDTKPAHVIAATDPNAPFSLTKGRFWKRHHRAIDPATFARAPIFSRSNCAACHQDAQSGLFYPPNIHIPEEPKP